MMPTLAGPPSTSHSSAGADPVARDRGQLEMCLERGQHAVGTLRGVAVPVMFGVEWHLLNEPQLIAMGNAEAQQLDRVGQPGPRIQHCVHLDR